MSTIKKESSGSTVRLVYGADGITYKSPNQLTLSLPFGWRSSQDEICLESLFMYYSWQNITAAKGNTSCSYIWTDNVTYPVVMPDGQYSFSDFNDYLHFVMKQNNHYLLDADGNEIYYLDVEANAVYYRLTVTSKPLPSSLPLGWTNPGPALVATTPQLVVSTGMQMYLGILAGTYPSVQQSTEYRANGTLVPVVTDIININIQVNVLGYDDFNSNNQVLHTFSPVQTKTSAGELIALQPVNLAFHQVAESTHSNITVSFVDQLNRPLAINDPNGLTVVLRIRKR